jgi:hypothetical protein
MNEGEAHGAPQPDDLHADDSADEPYLITPPADRMRVDLAHLDVQRKAALFAELIVALSTRSLHPAPKLAHALGVVEDALGISHDQYRVALCDLLGVPLDTT